MRLTGWMRRGDGLRRFSSLEASLNRTISVLNASITRLNRKYSELEERAKVYFERCVSHLSSGDEEHAKLYAEEIMQLKRLARVIMSNLLLMEQVKIRLETVAELTEVLALVVSIRQLLSHVASEVSSVSPDVSENLKLLSQEIETIVATTSAGIPTPSPSHTLVLEDEALRVLEEAKRIATEQIRMSFPDAPVMTDREKIVYDTITSMDETDGFDIDTVCGVTGLTRGEVEDALEELARKGLIEISYTEDN
ncbi:MAG: hypothetical protein NZ988_00795 [Thaumarchaeota archaeon]|nr:hypothetical protein [Candidatus Calditenuaceae archaeon]MDW8186572.1 hypothetical protein [Nitrososphaerota archaeon]